MSMAQLLALDLPETPINVAIDAIVAQLRGLVDRAGVPLFNDVDRAGDMLVEPPADQPIVCRLWHDSLSGASGTNNLFLPSWEVIVSLYLYFRVPVDDIHQHGFQAHRERFCRHVLTALEHPTLNAAGLAPTADWRFTAPAQFDIDHTAAYKRFGDFVTIHPPLFISRVDFKIDVHDTDRSTA